MAEYETDVHFYPQGGCSLVAANELRGCNPIILPSHQDGCPGRQRTNLCRRRRVLFTAPELEGPPD